MNESNAKQASSRDDVFSYNVMNHVSAIHLCLEHHLRMPALALIYCDIDFVAGLGRPPSKCTGDRSDFIDWVERYMACQSQLGVEGVDLYAARCGIVHAYTMDSNLSAKGSARRIMYAWGDREPEEPMRLLKSLCFREVMVKIETLFAAFVTGLQAFSARMDADPVFCELVRERSRKLFMDQPGFPFSDNDYADDDFNKSSNNR